MNIKRDEEIVELGKEIHVLAMTKRDAGHALMICCNREEIREFNKIMDSEIEFIARQMKSKLKEDK